MQFQLSKQNYARFLKFVFPQLKEHQADDESPFTQDFVDRVNYKYTVKDSLMPVNLLPKDVIRRSKN